MQVADWLEDSLYGNMIDLVGNELFLRIVVFFLILSVPIQPKIQRMSYLRVRTNLPFLSHSLIDEKVIVFYTESTPNSAPSSILVVLN
jgi:hypothetical protein